MPFVYSTLTNDQCYTIWGKTEFSRVATPEHKILIKGGANRATRALVTPLGIMTEVSAEDLAHLKNIEDFKRHEKGGFIAVRDSKVDPEVAVAADMEQRDQSAPATPQLFADANLDEAKPMEEKPSKGRKLAGRVAGLGDRE